MVDVDVVAVLQRLRHFADWSDNSSEYHILREVEHNFVTTFLEPERRDPHGPGERPASTSSATLGPEDGIMVCPSGEREPFCSLDQWLSRWGAILDEAKTFGELPVWLQYFPRVMFQVINKSGETHDDRKWKCESAAGSLQTSETSGADALPLQLIIAKI